MLQPTSCICIDGRMMKPDVAEMEIKVFRSEIKMQYAVSESPQPQI